jgi:hypothetical protein
MDNGRVDTLKNGNYKQYGLFENGNNKISELSREAIIGIHHSTPLNQLFFSSENVQALQMGIRNLVAQKSNGEFVIGMQSEVELQVVMRAIYLKEAKHFTYGIVEQVRELNQQVLDFCVPRILEEIRMFKYYKNDVSKLPTPLDRGEFSSAKGLRVLETKQL